jgi:glutathione S-transferase
MSRNYVLTSFHLCPFVQRSAIVMQHKGVPYEIRYIDLQNKPEWFMQKSPFGKVPILDVDGEVLFESQVIAEFVDESTEGRLHPEDPLARAKNRAMIEVVSTLIGDSFGAQLAQTEDEARKKVDVARQRLGVLDKSFVGPFYNGEKFSLVDAAAAPALQRLTWYDELEPSFEYFKGFDRMRAWRDRLLAEPAVQRSTVDDIRERFTAFVKADGVDREGRPSRWLGRRVRERLGA